MKIAVDFDGTCVFDAFPRVGDPVPNCISTLKELIANGHKIYLHTCRIGEPLIDAINWFRRNKIPLSGVNSDFEEIPDRGKIRADVYIDDKALGCPLINDSSSKARGSFVNWIDVREILEEQGFI